MESTSAHFPLCLLTGPHLSHTKTFHRFHQQSYTFLYLLLNLLLTHCTCEIYIIPKPTIWVVIEKCRTRPPPLYLNFVTLSHISLKEGYFNNVINIFPPSFTPLLLILPLPLYLNEEDSEDEHTWTLHKSITHLLPLHML